MRGPLSLFNKFFFSAGGFITILEDIIVLLLLGKFVIALLVFKIATLAVLLLPKFAIALLVEVLALGK